MAVGVGALDDPQNDEANNKFGGENIFTIFFILHVLLRVVEGADPYETEFVFLCKAWDLI